MDENGNPLCTSYEQCMKYGQTLSNLHKSGIDKNSTPQEIAAAGVGTTVDKNGRPNISSASQGQNYGKALKNYGLTTCTDTVKSVDVKASPDIKDKSLDDVKLSNNGSLSIALTGNYSEGFENYLRGLEKNYGAQYVFENVFKGDKTKYDPQKSEFKQSGHSTLIGTENEKFVYINPVINKQQSVFNNNIDGAAGYAVGSYTQGEMTATKEEQQYLYNLSIKTGMDYPLLLGIWCSENACKSYQDTGKLGGTMGSTFDISFIESGYIHDDGNGKTYNNNYKEQINKLVEETYTEVYGKKPSYKDKSANSIYYDSAVTCLLLTNTMYSPKAGGSNNNDSAWDAYIMYCNDFTRASEYADSIRKNMGWSNVDYENAMSQAHPETKLSVNYN